MRALAAGFLAAAAAACSSAATGKITSEETTGPPQNKEVPVLEVGKYAKVYSGDEGLKVTVVKVAPPPEPGEAEKALIEISGVESELDGLVLLYEKVNSGRDGWVYKTILRGEDHWTVHFDTRGSETRVRIYLPDGTNNPLAASYDEEASGEAEPEPLARRHAELVADGTIARLQKLNREERRARFEAQLEKKSAAANEACGKEVPVDIDWSTVSDEQLKDISVSSFCAHGGKAVARICEHPEPRQIYQSRVERIRCAFGKESSFSMKKDGTLLWSIDPEDSNLQHLSWRLIQPVFDRERVVLKSKDGVYLLLSPADADRPVYYSTDGKVFREHRETGRSSSGSHRYLFAGGQRSTVSFKDGTWKVSCGERELKLEDLETKERKKVLAAAELKEQAWKRTPFVLARDDRGRYYYVDRLLRKYGGKGFRVFIGLQGRLELTQLMDIVDDSQGTIFATRDGKLRLLVGRNGAADNATWIQGKKRKELTVLHTSRNGELIYGALGVYAGENLGSVCEEL